MCELGALCVSEAKSQDAVRPQSTPKDFNGLFSFLLILTEDMFPLTFREGGRERERRRETPL